MTEGANVLDFATDESFRLKNWLKHRDDPRYGVPYPYFEDFAAMDGVRFTRQLVFQHFLEVDQKGVISAIKWGYPRGKTQGGRWKPFSDAFRSPKLPDAIAELRLHPRSGANTIHLLNGCFKGIGTATTSKIAYFARLICDEGPCLIYDQMVRRAIRVSNDPALALLKSELLRRSGDCVRDEHYGLFVRGVHEVASRRNVTAAAVELELFKQGRELGPIRPSGAVSPRRRIRLSKPASI